ncbi:MAG TPA: glycerate kinase [Chitinophagaceae bacterium]
MHILVAPNAFKNSLAAEDAAAAIEKGLQQSKLQCSVDCFPIGDGGDGTGKLIVQHCNGEIIRVEVNDPLKRKIISSFGLIADGKTAVIEMADASGLRLLKPTELNPLRTSSYGTGELMIHALDKKVKRIVLCIGGSATVDGATGILQALGYQFLDKYGKELTDLPESLTMLDRIDDSQVDNRISGTELNILCDVENLLLGKEGAAPVFGPQKGASPGAVKKLELSLSALTNVILKQMGKDISTLKHGGAAGGVAAGLAGLLNAQLVNGIDNFLSLTGFEKKLATADLVITGEGSIDIQTLQGKGPFGVAKKAKEKGIPVIGLAGKIPLEIPAELSTWFDVLLPINPELTNINDALKNTGINLVRMGKTIGDMLSMNNG